MRASEILKRPAKMYITIIVPMGAAIEIHIWPEETPPGSFELYIKLFFNI